MFGGPTAMNGFPAGGFTLRLINSLLAAVVAALWGTKRRSRCREIVLTANGEAMRSGPVAVTHSILRWMGWHWQAPSFVCKRGTGLPGPAGWVRKLVAS